MKTVTFYTLAGLIFCQSAFAVSPPTFIALTPMETGGVDYDYTKEVGAILTARQDIVYDAIKVSTYVSAVYLLQYFLKPRVSNWSNQYQNEIKKLEKNHPFLNDTKQADFEILVNDEKTRRDAISNDYKARINKIKSNEKLTTFYNTTTAFILATIPGVFKYGNSSYIVKSIKKYFNKNLKQIQSRADQACQSQGAAHAVDVHQFKLITKVLSADRLRLTEEAFVLGTELINSPDKDFSDFAKGTYFMFDPHTVHCKIIDGQNVRIETLSSLLLR